MDEAVDETTCPNCAAGFTAKMRPEADVCPQCGRSLDPVSEQSSCAPESPKAESSAPPPKPSSEDQGLMARLRDAFQLDENALASPQSCLLGGGAAGEAASLATGTRLGDFEILNELGRGEMGIVYRARQVSLRREVALKVLLRNERPGSTAVERFRAEAEAAARTHHTNVVSVYAQGKHDDTYYYAMELIDGLSLDKIIRGRSNSLGSARRHGGSSTRWSWDDAALDTRAGADGANSGVDDTHDTDDNSQQSWTPSDCRRTAVLFAEVADALECAHASGIIHRDVKPHNLLLGRDNRLHLTDFGLARLVDEPHLTVSGEVMGTPAYLSPEQLRGDRHGIDYRTDIYSLGVTLYELLTGCKPFDGESREQIVTAICTTPPVPPRRRDRHIPLDLETICLRAMEKEPQRRHQSAALLAEDLQRFADGRPILSRRPSRIEKAAKWVRRHKAVTTAVMAVATVALLAVVLTWSINANRRREAERLLGGAYTQLAYFDYHGRGRVQADIARADVLGADPGRLQLARALGCMGVADWPGAIAHLEAVQNDDPTNLRGLYLLAWAQRENRQHAASRATFEQAELHGPPATPDAWFFRGLAVHYDEPQEAIESYRQAIALRSREHGFYPMAMLHLARAQNQQIYATRGLDTLSEADATLRQLIEHKCYGAYPYYLLSIAHRLAAEVYSGSSGTRDDSLVTEHYTEALEWARRGQAANPVNERPITAEAECLESMGRYAEAIEARSRAIEVATSPYARCEGYHYRWRLHYWMGELEGALADATRHAACDPHSRFYRHVYPALLLAEMDRMADALDHARALAVENPGDAQAVLWSATTLRLLGHREEAVTLLTTHADTVDCTVGLVPPQSPQWVAALYAYCRDGESLDMLDALAEETDSPWKLWGEAHFHAAVRHLVDGRREAAVDEFFHAYRCFDGEEQYTYHAKLVYNKLRQDADWPPWLTSPARAESRDIPDGEVGGAIAVPTSNGEGEH